MKNWQKIAYVTKATAKPDVQKKKPASSILVSDLDSVEEPPMEVSFLALATAKHVVQ